MKFSEMASSRKAERRAKMMKLILTIIAIIVVIILLVVLTKYVSKKSSGKTSTDTTVVTLNTESRLVQSLYSTVHAFNAPSPYWMYENESSIANMSESHKLALTYLNLNGLDFQTAPNDCEGLELENSYGKIVCNNRTIVKRDAVYRSYREIFGDNAQLTNEPMKVNYDTDTYVYNANIDAYVLYSTYKTPKGSHYTYDYSIYKAERIGNMVKIYESLDVRRENGAVEVSAKYVYTFKMADDGLYSYETIQKVA